MSEGQRLNKRGNRIGTNPKSVEALKPHRWPKGKSANPGGKRKDGQPSLSRRPITDALKRQLAEGNISPDDLAIAALKHARSNPKWWECVRDTIQGKPKQEILITDDNPALSAQQRNEVDGRILSILDAARTRYVERRRENGTRELAGATAVDGGTGSGT